MPALFLVHDYYDAKDTSYHTREDIRAFKGRTTREHTLGLADNFAGMKRAERLKARALKVC